MKRLHALRGARELRLKASVFESSREGIVITSGERAIVAANEAFATLSGYSIAELVGMQVNTLRSASLGVETFTQVWPDVQINDHWVGETLCRKKNGEDQPIELSIVCGGVLRAIGTRRGRNTYRIALSAAEESVAAANRDHR
jgi:PAS domain S-box-containing protein